MWMALWNVLLVLIWLLFVGEILMCAGSIFAAIFKLDSPFDTPYQFVIGVPYKYTKTGKQRWGEALGSIWVIFVSGVIVYFISLHFSPIIAQIIVILSK